MTRREHPVVVSGANSDASSAGDILANSFRWETVARTFLAASVAVASIVLLSRPDERQVSLPFVWPQLAVAHLLCAWPLALWLARAAERLGFAGVCTAFCVLAAVGASWLPVDSFAIGVAQRSVVATFAWTFGFVIARRFVSFCNRRTLEPKPSSVGAFLVLAVTAFVPAGLFASQRCEEEIARFAEFSSRERLANAERTAASVLALHPHAAWNRRSLGELRHEILTQLESLRDELAWSERADLRDSARIERCRRMASDGDWDGAVRDAKRLAELPATEVAACLLLGSLFEEKRAWGESLAWRCKARDLLYQAPWSRRGGLNEALDGIGFAHQNLGNYAAAEESLLDSLEWRSNASTLALLAGVYENAQNLEAANVAANKASELDPSFAATRSRMRDKTRRYRFCRPQAVESE